jgi:NurA-like 5'-3' nuclease
MRKIQNVAGPIYDEDGLIIFGEFYWEDADGQGWSMFSSAKELPKDLLDGLLKDYPTPLEKLMTENSTA